MAHLNSSEQGIMSTLDNQAGLSRRQQRQQRQQHTEQIAASERELEQELQQALEEELEQEPERGQQQDDQEQQQQQQQQQANAQAEASRPRMSADVDNEYLTALSKGAQDYLLESSTQGQYVLHNPKGFDGLVARVLKVNGRTNDGLKREIASKLIERAKPVQLTELTDRQRQATSHINMGDYLPYLKAHEFVQRFMNCIKTGLTGSGSANDPFRFSSKEGAYAAALILLPRIGGGTKWGGKTSIEQLALCGTLALAPEVLQMPKYVRKPRSDASRRRNKGSHATAVTRRRKSTTAARQESSESDGEDEQEEEEEESDQDEDVPLAKRLCSKPHSRKGSEAGELAAAKQELQQLRQQLAAAKQELLLKDSEARAAIQELRGVKHGMQLANSSLSLMHRMYGVVEATVDPEVSKRMRHSEAPGQSMMLPTDEGNNMAQGVPVIENGVGV